MLRRELNRDDMIRARIPRRHWQAKLDSAQPSVRDKIQKYIKNMATLESRGVGLLMWGPNGTGKTSATVVIGKEYRRRGRSLLFLECAELKSAVVSGEMFDDDQTLWERAKSVQVLILDDLGKGVQDRTGFGMRVIDELIRHRNANQRVTFVTTNIPIRALHEELKESTMHSLKECIHPVKIDGEDMRDDARNEIGEMLS